MKPILIASLAASAIFGSAAPAFAQKVLAEGVRELATQIGASATKKDKRRIAVVTFRELDGRSTVLGAFLAEELITNLFGSGGLQIVERSMLDRVMNELKLGGSGALDPDSAKHIGKLLGVDAIVTGSITDLQSYVAVNCRMIDVQTGAVFAAAQTRIVKDDDLRKIMGTTLGSPPGREPMEPASSRFETSGGNRVATTPAAATLSASADGLQLSLRACRMTPPSGSSGAGRGGRGAGGVGGIIEGILSPIRQSGEVECEGTLTVSQDRRIALVVGDSRAVDTDGDEHRAVQGRIGSQTGRSSDSVSNNLIGGVPTVVRLVFQNVSSSTSSFAIVEIALAGDEHLRRTTLQLRRVPVGR